MSIYSATRTWYIEKSESNISDPTNESALHGERQVTDRRELRTSDGQGHGNATAYMS